MRRGPLASSARRQRRKVSRECEDAKLIETAQTAPPIDGGQLSKRTRTESIVELLDLYPTLAELCGLPAPQGVEGTSLIPVLKNPRATVKEAALTQHPRPAYFDRDSPMAPDAMGYSIRTDRFRYTEWRDWKSGATAAREL